MKAKLITLAALAFALTPAIALAHTPQGGGHARLITVHDRSPKLHDHSTLAHH